MNTRRPDPKDESGDMGMLGSQPIALFLPSLAAGGAERVTLNLAYGMRKLGHAVDIVVASRGGPLKDSVPPGVSLFELGAGRTIASVPKLAQYLRRRRPRALLSALNHANLTAVWSAQLARFPGRLVLAEHHNLKMASGSLVEGTVLPGLMSKAYKRADAVVTVSQGVKVSLLEKTRLSEDLVKVIYNPVLSEGTRESGFEPVDHPFFDDPNTPVILGAGRLTRVKNFGNLINAFAQIHEIRESRLVIIGEGEERQELESLISSLNLQSVTSLPGFVGNPHGFYSRASVFVLSSDFEALPTVLIEALAAGAPVVATDCPSGPREILSDGKYGALVPIADPDALAEAIDRVLTEPPPPVDQAWLEQFTIEHATKRYMELLG